MNEAKHEAKHEAVAEALGRVPSGLFVVSASDGTNEGAFLGSWVMQAGFDPPSLTVGVGKDRALRAMMDRPGSRFAVSVVAAEERGQLGPYYKGVEPAPDALAAFEVERTANGLAVVKGCLAWMECETLGALAEGDHVVVMGKVVEARGGRLEEPAVHTRSNGLKY